MDNNTEDFFESVKNISLSKTKKFCFKKTVNSNENNAEAVTSPFFTKPPNLDEPKVVVHHPLENIKPATGNNYVQAVQKPGQANYSTKTVSSSTSPAKGGTSSPKFKFKKKEVSNNLLVAKACSSEVSNSFNNHVEKPQQNNYATKIPSSESSCTSGNNTPKFKFKKKEDSNSLCAAVSSHVGPKVSSSNSLSVKSDTNSGKFNFTKDKNNSWLNGINSGTSTSKLQRFGKLSTKPDSKMTLNKSASKSKQTVLNFAKQSTEVMQVPSTSKSTDSNNVKTNSVDEKTDNFKSDSPVVRPKKFVFKKKLSSSSSSTISNLTVPPSPINISSGECSPAGKSLVPPSKETTNCSIKLDDSVEKISQSLQTTDADYMDDAEFERRFGTSRPLPEEFLEDIDWGDDFETTTATTTSKTPTIDPISEIADINWHEDDFPEQTTANQFDNRQDDSQEFRKLYPHSEVVLEVLHQKFGLRTFRPHQREIINASLTQQDCFVLMPTGGGKSLCYQLPAILMPGVTIVISPLRALISDQVDKLNALDIPAAHMCSDVSQSQMDVILSKLHVREPIIKLLYLTPEKIVASQKVGDLIKSLHQRGKLARFVIDEVHCLSQWGHDFRPDYKQMSQLRKRYSDVPIICLTATATKQVEGDVINILGLKKVKTFIRSFNRPNIKYQVLPKTGKNIVNEIAGLIKQKFLKKSGIIYCLCRADCDNLARDLTKVGIRAKPYHAGMSDKVREKQQREWMQDQFHVIVATIAFGMGIDKPDVRFVIHNSIPKSVEAFYQESGRAGRDDETSYSYLFYSYGDVSRLQRLMKLDRNVTKHTLDGHFENLRQMVLFAENVVDCRRHLQLMHLGEKFDRQLCIQSKETTCDNCENINKYKTVDMTKEAKELGVLVNDISNKEKVTLLHIGDIYKGSKLKKILDKGHNNHKFYGAGAHLDRPDIHRVLKNLILKNILADFCTYNGEFPVVYIKTGSNFNTLHTPGMKLNIPLPAQKATKINKPEAEYQELSTEITPVASTSGLTAPSPRATKLQLSKIQVTCHEELLEECRRLAMERNVTLSSIMNLSAIKSMSDVLPKTKEEFLKIQHVTNANYAKYGEYFLKITKKYREELEKLQVPLEPVSSFNSSFDEDDWFSQSSSSSGVKRKGSYNGYKRGAKRYKRTYRRKRSPKKATAKKGTKAKTGAKKKGGGSKLELMPLHFH